MGTHLDLQVNLLNGVSLYSLIHLEGWLCPAPFLLHLLLQVHKLALLLQHCSFRLQQSRLQPLYLLLALLQLSLQVPWLVTCEAKWVADWDTIVC